MDLPRWLLRWTLASLCFLVLAVTTWLVLHALMLIIPVTSAVVVAVLLTALLEPAQRRLTGWHLPDWLAAILGILVTLAAVVAVFAALVLRAIGQLSDLRGATVQSIDRINEILTRLPGLSEARISDAQERLVSTVQEALPTASAGATLVSETLTALALAVFLWFFLLKDGSGMWAWFVGWMPASRRAPVDRGGHAAWAVLTNYIRGTVAIAFIDAVGIGAGMLALGVPLTASLTCVVFLGAFVPIVGSVVAGAMCVGVTLVTVGAVPALILLGVVLLVQQVEGNLLQPWIMGHALRLHPVTIVVAVTLGAFLGGVLGALVAVPLVAVVYRLMRLHAGREDPEEPAAGPRSARAHASAGDDESAA